MNLREEIVEKRRQRISREGYALGHTVPETRELPLQSFTRDPFVICEIKRRSPSRGDIAPGLDPVEQAAKYYKAGVRSVSVLTEEDHFSGSLEDLMRVKKAFPDLAVLRKDFLVDEEDLEVSYRAGADAILLIVSALEDDELSRMHRKARDLGMVALVEVHSLEEVERVRDLGPELVGINARNLEDFSMDLLLPPVLKNGIDWPSSLVFESGIFSGFQARWAAEFGFRGVLVGEAAVKDPKLAAGLLEALALAGTESLAQAKLPSSRKESGFWQVLSRRLFYLNHLSPGARYAGPLVKICGITRREDALEAAKLGADMLGFVFADSPRKASLALLRELQDLSVLKVIVLTGDPESLGPHEDEVRQAIDEGLVDALQLHGEESPAFCQSLDIPWYKALRPQFAEDAGASEAYRSARVLIDAFDPSSRGGTGKRIRDELVREFARVRPLWLAGGIRPDNLASIVSDYRPELVDVSSGLEQSPGKKDHTKLRQFFKEIQGVRQKTQNPRLF